MTYESGSILHLPVDTDFLMLCVNYGSCVSRFLFNRQAELSKLITEATSSFQTEAADARRSAEQSRSELERVKLTVQALNDEVEEAKRAKDSLNDDVSRYMTQTLPATWSSPCSMSSFECFHMRFVFQRRYFEIFIRNFNT